MPQLREQYNMENPIKDKGTIAWIASSVAEFISNIGMAGIILMFWTAIVCVSIVYGEKANVSGPSFRVYFWGYLYITWIVLAAATFAWGLIMFAWGIAKDARALKKIIPERNVTIQSIAIHDNYIHRSRHRPQFRIRMTRKQRSTPSEPQPVVPEKIIPTIDTKK